MTTMIIKVSHNHKDVLVLIPNKCPTRVSREPTHFDAKKAKREPFTNLIAVEPPVTWDQDKGYQGIMSSSHTMALPLLLQRQLCPSIPSFPWVSTLQHESTSMSSKMICFDSGH